MVQGHLMLLGYNTNGLADHDLASAIELVADLGYQSIAITLDHHKLNPYGESLEEEIAKTKELLKKHKLAVVIETGARFLLDPRRKHHPTLVSPRDDERQRRIDFLRRAIDIGSALEAKCVSLWSGATGDGAAVDCLADSLTQVLDHAAACRGSAVAGGLALAFEPEPGHIVDTMASFERLLEKMDEKNVDTNLLGLTIDIGHLHCQGETPIADYLRKWSGRLVNVHIEDMRHGVHEHLMFGDGEIDFPPIIAALKDIDYNGPVTVELSRHSHMGVEAAERAIQFLRSQ